MATKKDSKDKLNGLGVAVGLSAVAAAVGAYFMYGSKNAAKNRRAVKSWVFKAKADILEALENTQDITKREYEKLVDTVSSAYVNIESASKADMAAFKKEMKDYWVDIAKTAVAKKEPAKKAAKKAAKKVSKKVSEKKAEVKKAVKKAEAKS